MGLSIEGTGSLRDGTLAWRPGGREGGNEGGGQAANTWENHARPREEMQEAGLAQCPERLPGGLSAGVQGWWGRKTESGWRLPGSWRTRVPLDLALIWILPSHRHFQLDAIMLPFHASF